MTVTYANDTDLYFRYNGGMANVKLRDCPPDVQKQFNYDPDVAAAADQQQQDNASHYVPNMAPAYSGNSNDSAAPAAAAGPDAAVEIPRLVDSVGDNSPLDKPAPPVTVEKWLTDKPVNSRQVWS